MQEQPQHHLQQNANLVSEFLIIYYFFLFIIYKQMPVSSYFKQLENK